MDDLGHNLVFSDWIMFDRVMQNESICAAFLETVLGLKVRRIEYSRIERPVRPYLHSKAIQMDVFVRDSERAYDIEMQACPEPNLARRLRYYQGSMDVADLKPGQSYRQLLDSYIVFLCLADPFSENEPVYTVEPACKEAPHMPVPTGQTWVVLNAAAWRAAPTESLRNLLEYISKRQTFVASSDPLVASIDGEVSKANRDAAWKDEAMGFMTLEHHMLARKEEAEEQAMARGMEQGMARGIAAGEARYSKLVEELLSRDRVDDLKKAAEDSEYRQELFTELGI